MEKLPVVTSGAGLGFDPWQQLRMTGICVMPSVGAPREAGAGAARFDPDVPQPM